MTMQSQDIFKAFGSNWKWASVSNSGTARVHTVQPTFSADGVVCYSLKENTVARCPAFNIEAGGGARIIDRTDFSNGPSYETDKFGIPLTAPAPQAAQQPAPLPPRGYCSNTDCWNEKAVGWNQCETHRPPQLAAPVMPPAPVQVARYTHLTTNEAENGGLWEFAQADETFVRVWGDGTVYFYTDSAAGVGRWAQALRVDGVVTIIERTRSQPQLAPPEAGKPYIDEFDAQPVAPVRQHEYVARCPGTSAEVCKSHACGCDPVDYSIPQPTEPVDMSFSVLALTKAKAHAKYLLKTYDALGHQALLPSQYLAIFGELPQ